MALASHSTSSSPTASEAVRLAPLTAEFRDPEMERYYRQKAYPGLRTDFRMAVAVGAFFYLAFAIPDYAALGDSPAFWRLFYLRATITALAIGLMQWVEHHPAWVTNGWAASFIELIAIAGNFVIIITRPGDLAAHASAMIVILVAVYVFLPNRFLLAFGVALVGTVSFLVYLFGWAQADKTTLISLLGVLLLINSFGTLAAYRFSHLRRREFAALEAQRVSNEALLSEIARREALETALTVEKNAAERARDQAEAASRAKSRFLAAASHDLRQPMHALSLFAATLVERLRYPEVRHIADQMQASIIALTSLFDSLLDISKLDAGAIKACVVSFRLKDLFDNVRRDFTGKAYHKGIRFQVVDTALVVRSDPLLLERIVRNLAANAVNYTEQGGVVIGARRRGKLVRIEVWDSGPGIPEEEQQRVFEEFYQIANPERDRSKGLGLGLAIVKRLAELLHHPIDVRSRPGRGACFAVTVPRGVLRQNARTEEAAPAPEFLRASAERLVVLIEDERIIREATQTLLSDWGCKVIASASADEAVAQLLQADRLPDLVIADYRLAGGRTGIDAIDAVQEAVGAAVPAVLITGDTAADHLKRAREHGYPVLHKPVPPAKLRALVASIPPRAPLKPAGAPVPTESASD
ncbi:ATP-binding response regulator [Thiobacter aerophilum]|uniref:histidine kinase n=1 Tax=Thiobacter aerophilum TaxID=3121275 RepID=A0ABV0EC62_9BURK